MAFTDDILLIKPSNIVYYGKCTTSSATSEKIVTLINGSNFQLKEGTRISVFFTYANTATSATLNVNNTGTKSILWNGTDGLWTGNSVFEFVFNGSYWSCSVCQASTSTYGLAKLTDSYTGNSKTLAASQYALYSVKNLIPSSSTFPLDSKVLYRGVDGIGFNMGSGTPLNLQNPVAYYSWRSYSMHIYGWYGTTRIYATGVIGSYSDVYENGALDASDYFLTIIPETLSATFRLTLSDASNFMSLISAGMTTSVTVYCVYVQQLN